MKTRFWMILGIVSIVIGIFFTLGFLFVQSTTISYAHTIFESCYDDDKCTIDMLYEISQKESSQDNMIATIDDLVDLYSGADLLLSSNITPSRGVSLRICGP